MGGAWVQSGSSDTELPSVGVRVGQFGRHGLARSALHVGGEQHLLGAIGARRKPWKITAPSVG